MDKKIRAIVRENQLKNLKRLLAEGESSFIINACKDFLENDKMSIRASADKNGVSPTSIQRYLNKLNDNHASSLDEKRGAKERITKDEKNKLREILKTPPFALEKYYPSIEWTQGVLQKYLSENFNLAYSTRKCRFLLNELSPLKEIISNELKKDDLANIWLFMNIKICELKTEENHKTQSYFVCFAYRYGKSCGKNTDDFFFYKTSKTRTYYSDFIRDILENQIKSKSIIFFVESKDSSSSTRKKPLFFFECYKDKIQTIIPITIDSNEFYDEWNAFEYQKEVDADKGKSTDKGKGFISYTSIFELFNKKLPYEFDEESDEDENQTVLKDDFDFFSNALYRILFRCRIILNHPNFDKSPDNVMATINEIFNRIWMMKKD